MSLDVNSLTSEIITCCTYGAGIGIIIALCEWVVCFFYRAITDRLGRGNRV